jgi:hypothetical protein
MKKIKLKQVVKHIYKFELEEFKDNSEYWWDCTKEEKAEAIKEFKEDWKEIETIDDLIGILTERGYSEDLAVDTILQAVIEA